MKYTETLGKEIVLIKSSLHNLILTKNEIKGKQKKGGK